MDTFQKYDNTLGFFVGNENVAKRDDSPAAPFLKAAARDMKAYRDAQGYRKIPVGYSAADIMELRPMLQDYLTCGGNASESVDFFGLNSYSWCDPSSYTQSTYDRLQAFSRKFPVPIFFTETGCIVPGPRKWDDQDAIFSKPMVDDWSGAIIYEWIQEQNNYGIIEYGPPAPPAGDNKAPDQGKVVDGFTRKGTPTPKQPDFGNLQTKWAGIRPTGVSKADYDASKAVSTRPCPSSTPGGWWQVDGNVKLPVLGETKARGDATAAPSATAHGTKDAPPSSATDAPEQTEAGRAGAGGDSDSAASPNGPLSLAGAGLGVLAAAVLSLAVLL